MLNELLLQVLKKTKSGFNWSLSKMMAKHETSIWGPPNLNIDSYHKDANNEKNYNSSIGIQITKLLMPPKNYHNVVIVL